MRQGEHRGPASRRMALAGSTALTILAAIPAARAGGVQTLDPVTVVDSADDLIGTADTATEGTVLRSQIESRPVYREGELLENVPGLLVTQHSGEGKANQYYLRGFNLDHGTDISISVDDMPVNQPTNAHGQGYADLNFMIPELISGMKYEKGTYDAALGDFATAGAVQIDYLDTLDKDWAEVGFGSFGYQRGFTAMSRPVGNGNLLMAVEGNHLDGPWKNPDDYRKGNGVIRYSEGTADNGWSTTVMAYGGRWNATNQIPQRAVDDGQLSYWGSEDKSDGGWSHRLSLSGKMVRTDGDTQLKASAYLIQSGLDLYNNFTYYLNDPVNGDQFHQHESRLTAGGAISDSKFTTLAGLDTEHTLGVQVRNDVIDIGLYQTRNRQQLSIDRVDKIDESSVGVYYENHTQWLSKLRTVIGLRGDLMHASDNADDYVNFPDDPLGHHGEVTNYKPSPKGSLILGPWAATEFYLSAGEGYHSNDVRTAAYAVQSDYLSTGPGSAWMRYPLMERAVGYEVGARTAILPHLQTSLAFFQLNLQSEQVYAGDSAADEPSGASTRRGIEFANFYTPAPGIVIDADAAVSQARFDKPVYDGTDDTCCTGRYIAGSPGVVIGSGVEIDDIDNWFGGLQVRYYGPRPLTNDNSVRSSSTTLVNMRVGYKLTETLSIRLDIDNLLNQKMEDVAYYYVSRLPGERSAGVADIHFHAAEPLGTRLSLVARW
jgi:outer membrane receptor protein involved in Fe transport